jgi:O-antigen/teichoic acid export membrane protein
VFGPVPAKYRFIVWLCGLAVFAGLGVLFSPDSSLSTAVTATLGLTLGAVAVLLFLHDFQHPQQAHLRTRRR